MMGIFIFFNNLGCFIEEVFVGFCGNFWNNLVVVERVVVVGVKWY